MNISKLLKNLAICCCCLIVTKSNSVFSTDDEAFHEIDNDNVVKNNSTCSTEDVIFNEVDNVEKNDCILFAKGETLHEIDKKVFQHNVSIINPNGCCTYEFYAPNKKHYSLIDGKLKYCSDRFRFDQNGTQITTLKNFIE